MKALAVSAEAQNLRFWGKIRGTAKDYYIVQGVSNQGAGDDEEGSGREARGSEGVNQFAYWASNSPAGPFTVLPDLDPSDLAASKSIKVLFTGDLTRKIITNPFFFKTEREHLRATIARISFSTTLVPRNIYRMVEESTDIEENRDDDDNIPMPSTQDMCKASNWVHYTRNILQCNKLVHDEPADLDDDADPE
jgi:hypothetical protein